MDGIEPSRLRPRHAGPVLYQLSYTGIRAQALPVAPVVNYWAHPPLLPRWGAKPVFRDRLQLLLLVSSP